MSSPARPVRVRIAPSPTGDPHVGTAYIALFNYVFARQQGGRFVLRIEDTDQKRARSDSEQMIFDALRWCGLTWDEGPDVGGPHAPYRQSERAAIYAQHVAVLLDKGAAYRCFCSEERLASVRDARSAAKLGGGYDRHCRDLPAAEVTARVAAGEAHVVRMKIPLAGAVAFTDRLRGVVSREASEFDDQVLLKSDGLPTYHLANVVDDHLMEITHVIRAEEWISSTGKHVLLYQAFGWELPEFIHMPLLRNPDKTKIAKRHNPTSIFYYRDIGILPETFLNFLGTLGYTFGQGREKFTLDEMIASFAWDRVALGGPVFDVVKMISLNGEYLRALSVEQLADRVIAWRLNRDYLTRLMALAQPRIERLDQLVPLTEYFFTGDLDYGPVVAAMRIDGVAPGALAEAILALVERLDARVGWARADLEAESKAWAAERGWKPKQALPVLRFALSARHATPGIFEMMELLGKDLARRRLRRAAEAIAATASGATTSA